VSVIRISIYKPVARFVCSYAESSGLVIRLEQPYSLRSEKEIVYIRNREIGIVWGNGVFGLCELWGNGGCGLWELWGNGVCGNCGELVGVGCGNCGEMVGVGCGNCGEMVGVGCGNCGNILGVDVAING
jgi:hypothetical protein